MAKRKTRAGEGFVLVDGQVLETKAQLVEALKAMSDNDFAHFCNSAKNDFATWLRDCLDAELAARIEPIRDRGAMIAALKTKSS